FTGLTERRLVFVNGHYAPEISSPGAQITGLVLSNLAGALVSHPDLVQKHLGRLASGENDSFTSLNTAFFQDGAFIHVSANCCVEEPIQLLFISAAQENGATAHPRNLIVAERGSQVTVLESYVSTVEQPYFTNAVTELVAGEGAVVEHCK